MTDADTVVLGVGSPLMGDDGLGVEVVARLSARWAETAELSFIDGGVWGMRVLPYIESARRLLVIDAIRADGEPGTLVRMEREEIPRYLRTKLSPHQIDLSEVLAVAELRGTYPPEAIALGIEPETIEPYTELSDAVREAMPALEEAVLRQLAAWGHELRRKETGARA